MKLRSAVFALAFVIGQGLSASTADAATACHLGSVPAPGSKINAGLLVDGRCEVTGITVNGGVAITGTGQLIMFDSTVNGGISVAPGGELDLGYVPATNRGGTGSTVNGGITLTGAKDLDIWNSTINGGVAISGTFAFNYFPTFCGNEIKGSVSIADVHMQPAGARFYFGDARDNTIFGVRCPANTIQGSLAMSNSTQFELEDNTISGSVMLSNSSLELNGNTIGGSLRCTNGTVIVPGEAGDAVGNTVHGNNDC